MLLELALQLLYQFRIITGIIVADAEDLDLLLYPGDRIELLQKKGFLAFFLLVHDKDQVSPFDEMLIDLDVAQEAYAGRLGMVLFAFREEIFSRHRAVHVGGADEKEVHDK